MVYHISFLLLVHTIHHLILCFIFIIVFLFICGYLHYIALDDIEWLICCAYVHIYIIHKFVLSIEKN